MRASASIRRGLSGILAALVLAFCLAAAPAHAEDQPQPPVPAELKDGALLDGLFAQLRVAPDYTTAHRIEGEIWTIWLTPADEDLRHLMSEVLDSREVGDIPEAIRLLDKLVVAYPGYAEAWNQRATMHYMVGDLEGSLADCARVLELEPRHFGALAGRALIYLSLGKRDLALKDITAGLAIHPFLPEQQLFPELQKTTHT
jgi:tetratricopeptide (TPR) repeat protein